MPLAWRQWHPPQRAHCLARWLAPARVGPALTVKVGAAAWLVQRISAAKACWAGDQPVSSARLLGCSAAPAPAPGAPVAPPPAAAGSAALQPAAPLTRPQLPSGTGRETAAQQQQQQRSPPSTASPSLILPLLVLPVSSFASRPTAVDSSPVPLRPPPLDAFRDQHC
jgi:hypothetical protein